MIKKIMLTTLLIIGSMNYITPMENPAVKYSVIGASLCCCCNIIGTTAYALYIEKNHTYYEQRNTQDQAQRIVALQEQQAIESNHHTNLHQRIHSLSVASRIMNR